MLPKGVKTQLMEKVRKIRASFGVHFLNVCTVKKISISAADGATKKKTVKKKKTKKPVDEDFAVDGADVNIFD